MERSSWLLLSLALLVGSGWAQTPTATATPVVSPTANMSVTPQMPKLPVLPILPKDEEIVVETEIDDTDQIAIEDHVEEMKRFFLYEIRYAFSPKLVSVTPFTCNKNKVGFRARLIWEEMQKNQFNSAEFDENFRICMENYKAREPSLFITKKLPTGKLPGMKFGNNFSANFYGTPLSYLEKTSGFATTNNSFAGKNNSFNNDNWFEGSARVQLFMDLSNFLNMKNHSKILLTAGYYTSFIDVKEQNGLNGYINNINGNTLKFHGPTYGEFDLGVRVLLDGRKKKTSPKPYSY